MHRRQKRFSDAHPRQQRKNGSRHGHQECTSTPSSSAPKAISQSDYTHVRMSVHGGRLYTWKVRKGWLLTSTTASMCSAAEFPPPSISLPRWFLLLAVSGLFYLTRKQCKIDHTIWLGIEEIGCSSQSLYITYWCCIGVTVIDTRAHLPPYYNLTEATHSQNMSMSRSWRLSWLWGERSVCVCFA